MNKLLAAAVILAFFLLLSVGNPCLCSLDLRAGVPYWAQTSQESSAKDDEDFEDAEEYEVDEEFDDEVVEINDPFYGD